MRQVEGGASVAEVCRKTGITEQTFYHWKKKFAGMGVAELARLRQPEDDNKKLKSLVADLTLTKKLYPSIRELFKYETKGFDVCENGDKTLLSHNAVIGGLGNKGTPPETVMDSSKTLRIAGSFTLVPLDDAWPAVLTR